MRWTLSSPTFVGLTFVERQPLAASILPHLPLVPSVFPPFLPSSLPALSTLALSFPHCDATKLRSVPPPTPFRVAHVSPRLSTNVSTPAARDISSDAVPTSASSFASRSSSSANQSSFRDPHPCAISSFSNTFSTRLTPNRSWQPQLPFSPTSPDSLLREPPTSSPILLPISPFVSDLHQPAPLAGYSSTVPPASISNLVLLLPPFAD